MSAEQIIKVKERIGNTNEISDEERVEIIKESSKMIGRSVFFSVIIMIISFAPILFLTGQEFKMFSPLVLTKTFSLIGAAILAITVAPMLTRTFMKGKLIPESRNPVSNLFVTLYKPVARFCLDWRKTVLAACLALVIGSIPLVTNLGSEFMPPLDEGSLLFMPVTLPDVSNSEAKRIMQLQDKIIKSFPEVENVLGKAGRANTATDNSPISMIETMVILKPKNQWRKNMTKAKLITEMNEKVQIPGVSVGWTMPIINRINMLSTGIRTDVGIKIYGKNLDSIYNLSRQVENTIQGIEGLADLYVEQLTGGKYLDIKIRRRDIARYGLNVDDVNMVIESALGGMILTTTVEGRERFNVNLRLAQEYRNDIDEIERIPIQTMNYGVVPLSAVANVKITEGPPMISSENAMLRGTVLFNVRGRDMGSVVKDAKERIDETFKKLPQGYYIEWSGQYENQVRANQRLSIIIPIVLLIIAFILFITFHSYKAVLMVFVSIPVALIGGVYSLYYYNVNFSVAVAVGFIALFGVAVSTGVLMISYLNDTVKKLVQEKGNNPQAISFPVLKEAILFGATQRVRPLLMTVLANILGLIPVLVSTGTGSDVMKPITIPFVFGLISATLFVLIVLPVIFNLVKEWELKRSGKLEIMQISE
ncbi:efflux RND transporter permease subunit [Agriterribacter sp.]|uniref:efflux RND transporter permease subunit n=1 Tax=Agriterribacter sp. TaxID=2821509 RepID=UPI002B73CAA5|nr:efflux RND transporter permease subunit [Agriterribacter sp.]HRN48011.1 efflux RND transporter permease subunit [Niabella sp.]HRO47992.1 efflux RND transporter permease subunit [Agriterribacter sp.]